MSRKPIDDPILDVTGDYDTSVIINPYAYVVGGGGFAPTDIAGCILWLKGDNAPAGTVSDWPDLSGNGNDAVSFVGLPDDPSKVVGDCNGHDVVGFVSTQRLVSPAAWLSTRTIIFVAKTTSTPGVYLGIDCVCIGNSYSDGEVFITNSFGSNTQTYYGGQGSAYLNGSIAAAPPDNYPQTVYAVGAIVTSGGGSSPDIMIGHERGGAGGSPSNINIAELVIYDSALSSADREAVENYLGARYGITITH